MIRVAINNCYGGFGISHEGMLRYAEIKGITLYPVEDKLSIDPYEYFLVPENERAKNLGTTDFRALSMDECISHNKKHDEQTLDDYDIARDDPALIQMIEELGKNASGRFAELEIVELPDDMKDNWEIDEYDGKEHVAECHRTFYWVNLMETKTSVENFRRRMKERMEDQYGKDALADEIEQREQKRQAIEASVKLWQQNR